ncbi:hypothetical protein D3C77_747200 [compost metagenome]
MAKTGVNQLGAFRSTNDRGHGHQSRVGLTPLARQKREAIDHNVKLRAALLLPTPAPSDAVRSTGQNAQTKKGTP